MFVVETILSSQFAWVSVFSSSNLSLKHAYINFSKLSIACCVSGMYEGHFTGCNRRNGPDFRRVFLMLNYTEKPQNTYIQS